MTPVLRRLGWAAVALLLLLGAALASMVRVVPAAGPAEHAPAGAPPQVAPSPAGSALVVPVRGVPRAAVRNSWGDARGSGRSHQGIDIAAPAGTPVLAAAPGAVEKLYFSRGGGGITLYVRSPDRRWSYYYAHLQGYAPGMREGRAVRAGEEIGFVGDTGNAGAGNTHLHFAMARMRPGDRWWEGEPVNPYPLLAASGAGR